MRTTLRRFGNGKRRKLAPARKRSGASDHLIAEEYLGTLPPAPFSQRLRTWLHTQAVTISRATA